MAATTATRIRQARLVDNHRRAICGYPITHTTTPTTGAQHLRRKMVDESARSKVGARNPRLRLPAHPVPVPIIPNGNLELVQCLGDYDPLSQVTVAKVEFRIRDYPKRRLFDLDTLKRALDPRLWATLCREEGWSLSDEVDISSGEPVAKPFPPGTAGTDWKGQFHEIFECAWSQDFDAFTRFDVILSVEYRCGKLKKGDSPLDVAANKAIVFNYSLFAPISCKVFQRDDIGGIDIDSGCLVVTPDRAYASKSIRFTAVSVPGGTSLVPSFASPLNVTAPALVSLCLHEGLAKAFNDYIY